MAWSVILFARSTNDWFPAAPVTWAYYYLLFALIEATDPFDSSLA